MITREDETHIHCYDDSGVMYASLPKTERIRQALKKYSRPTLEELMALGEESAMLEGVRRSAELKVGDVYSQDNGCILRVTGVMEESIDEDEDAAEGWTYFVRPLNGPYWTRDEVPVCNPTGVKKLPLVKAEKGRTSAFSDHDDFVPALVADLLLGALKQFYAMDWRVGPQNGEYEAAAEAIKYAESKDK